MTRAAALIATALAWTACSVAGPARPPGGIEMGREFSLKPGEAAQSADAAMQVGFEGVTSDSRCPKGEQCVWAGEATIRLWLQQGSGPRQLRELRSTPGAAHLTQASQAGDLELRLVRVEPYPISGRAIAKGDYIATLTLGRAPRTAVDR